MEKCCALVGLARKAGLQATNLKSPMPTLFILSFFPWIAYRERGPFTKKAKKTGQRSLPPLCGGLWIKTLFTAE
jgi:hypothetical protein